MDGVYNGAIKAVALWTLLNLFHVWVLTYFIIIYNNNNQ